MRRNDYHPFMAMQPKDWHLEEAVRRFIEAHGGEDAMIADEIEEDATVDENGGIHSKSQGVLFFPDGALLGRSPMAGNEWILMSEPPPAGSLELLQRQRIYWLNQFATAQSNYSLLKRSILDSGDESSLGKLNELADAAKVTKFMVRSIEKKIAETPEKVSLREREDYSREATARYEQYRRRQQERVARLVAEVSVADGSAPLPLEESLERKAEREDRIREFQRQTVASPLPLERR